jgi:acyl-CoA thioesterase I
MIRFLSYLALCAALAFAPTRARADQPVILVFGDSLSAGYGLPSGSGWVHLLQQRLQRDKYNYRVVNASISGETTVGGRNRLADALEQYRPRIVILELGANDGLRGQSVQTMQDNLAHLVQVSQAAGAKVVLVGMQIPPNYGPDYTKKFRAAFATVARQTGAALVPFLMEGFADRREMFQPDGVHPTVEAQQTMLNNIWPKLRPLLSGAASKG